MSGCESTCKSEALISGKDGLLIQETEYNQTTL